MKDFTNYFHGHDLGHGVVIVGGLQGGRAGYVKVNGETVAKAEGGFYWNRLLAAAAEFLPLDGELATKNDEAELVLAA
jgi:hypothetical protein